MLEEITNNGVWEKGVEWREREKKNRDKFQRGTVIMLLLIAA